MPSNQAWMAGPGRNRLGAALGFIALLALAPACDSGSSPTVETQPANTPGATPDSSQNVNCPGSGGPSSGTLTGLGASIG